LLSYTCVKGDDEIVHVYGIQSVGKEEDSSSSNVFTISGKRFKKACVKREKLSEFAGQDKWKKNNDDTDNRLVIVIFSRKV